MTLVLPEGYASVIHSLGWVGDPEPMAITYAVSVTDPVDVSDLADALADAVVAVIEGAPTVLSLIQTEVKLQDTAPPSPPSLGVSTTTAVGVTDEPVIPQNSAYLIHKRTGVGGRTGRGRLFLPGVMEDVVNNVGVITSGQVTALQGDFSDWLASIAAITEVGNMVLLHDSEGAGADQPPFEVTSLVVDNRISTQRRRLRR